MTRFLVPLIIILFIGCNNSDKPKSTHFGGKIINPKCSYVTLSDNYNFNDTIFLNKDNTFIGSYKDFKEGLYIFEHGPEHQYVYLEPNDSLLFRLNTWDFDESLVFSGTNAARNNILIEAFLESEYDDKKIAGFYKLPQKEFLSKINSIKKLKQKAIDNYRNSTEDESEEFLKILDIAMLYPVYSKLEEYASHNFSKKESEKLVDTYFDYRTTTYSNRDSLMFFGPYYRFIIEKLYNDVYQKNLENGNSDNFTIDLLKNIDSKISSEEIKNKLLYNTLIRHFFKEPKNTTESKAFHTFFKLNTDIDQKKNVQRLINDLKLLSTGDELPSFNLVDATGELKNISQITKGKNSVLLFKNYKQASDEWVSSRVNFLIKNNPQVEFVIVNLCDSSKRYTKNIDIKYQYKLPKQSNVCDFSSSKFPRMVLVDKNGIIQNGYTSLSAKDINLQINELKNK
ncbi:hypothetical protein H3Z83_01555 [Tenacibaculum sp. S7007]|uniref:Thioredoxin domain-containing protein n=1 Tax=Tenacibaculum pelagium TaxID=2759527 RepID=A0A839AJ89_9FLAO|nr:hypothetical protein [Tenacibaculum pelagium]MBA6155212.1 hypothetical protein [Tenacibaculum pelagium]